MYYILGFCSMMNVNRIINSLGEGICLISFNHGKGSKVPFHSCLIVRVKVFENYFLYFSIICNVFFNKVGR
jgi:hypothetical protein